MTNGSNSKIHIDELKKELWQAYQTPAFASNEVWCKEMELWRVLGTEERY